MAHLHEEELAFGNPYRAEALEELRALAEKEKKKAEADRRAYFTPDMTSVEAYTASAETYRSAYKAMLGRPLTPAEPAWDAPVEETFVAEDELAKIYRLRIPVVEGLHTYGLLFLPKADGPRPLVICQHGGAGTPERISGFFGTANYNDLLRRVLQRGAVCFAPQLYLWKEPDFGPTADRIKLDGVAKLLGGSAAALEVRMISAAIDALVQRPEVDAGHIGMLGLSYGGLYATLTPAADPRIRVTCASCSFTDLADHHIADWAWFNAGRTFSFVEIAKLICPRALYLENGTDDPLFDLESARRLAPEAAEAWEKLGIEDKFRWRAFQGEHELSKDPEVIDFLFDHL